MPEYSIVSIVPEDVSKILTKFDIDIELTDKVMLEIAEEAGKLLSIRNARLLDIIKVHTYNDDMLKEAVFNIVNKIKKVVDKINKE